MAYAESQLISQAVQCDVTVIIEEGFLDNQIRQVVYGLRIAGRCGSGGGTVVATYQHDDHLLQQGLQDQFIALVASLQLADNLVHEVRGGTVTGAKPEGMGDEIPDESVVLGIVLVRGRDFQVNTVFRHGCLRHGDLFMLDFGPRDKERSRGDMIGLLVGTQCSVTVGDIVNLVTVFAVTVHWHEQREFL